MQKSNSFISLSFVWKIPNHVFYFITKLKYEQGTDFPSLLIRLFKYLFFVFNNE